MLLGRANASECQHLINALKVYQASGHEINYKKSTVSFSKGSSPTTKSLIQALTIINKIGGFGRYLGLPEQIGRSRYDTFTYIEQKLQNKLQSWYTRMLSQAGKKILIKAAGTTLPIYTMSCSIIPKKLLQKLTSLIRNF